MFDSKSRRWPNCGCFVIIERFRKYIPLVKVESYSLLLNNASRTTLTQTFVNPQKDRPLEELVYELSLYDDVSVVSDTCTFNGRVIHGRVKSAGKRERPVSQGQPTSLLDQSHGAGDAFAMRIGNIPPQAKVKVEIIYLGELRNDAEMNGIRFALPRSTAPRYGSAEMFPTASGQPSTAPFDVSATVDVLMSRGSIRSIQSASHPIAVQLGSLSTDSVTEADSSPRKASVSIVLRNAHMEKDFILQIAAADLGDPCALLETHPSIPSQRALMITLVPKFSLPPEDPDIIFSVKETGRFSLLGAKSDVQTSIPALTTSLNTLLRHLPFGMSFNVYSLGSRQVPRQPSCVVADKSTVAQAIEFSSSFFAESRGMDLFNGFEYVFRNRNMRKSLEIFFLTSNLQPAGLDSLFARITNHVAESRGSIRIFSLGVGPLVSHALVESVARAGNGFAQFVSDGEKAEKKLVRMLSCSMMPHITDYTLEIKYRQTTDDITAYYDGHYLVDEKIVCVANEKGAETESRRVSDLETAKGPGQKPKKKISLFDKTIKDDEDIRALGGHGADKELQKLPDIPRPASFQTPYQIPPLYPFNRSNVYAMLSGSRIPETVTLQGTFIQGLARE
ncbi:unnamed protein product [Clonostachys rosea]|uniref:VIT domain-containing protein n=1 Tax=Bionectria ochroleuca TaxID=29856 RepID=A0ABY6UB16_BIOOC|nr:unnamed protein product [Clonostachys rosea]